MIGQTLGNWTIECEVGLGAMGTVYRALGADGRIAAVKVLAPEFSRDELFLSRFRREIEAMQLLDHPRIVRLFDSGEEAGRFYLAMEFIAGGNYERRLQSRGRLPWIEALTVGRQVGEALKHAHDHGVIHRDLKPANVLLESDPDGPAGVSIKLTDFGVAKLFASPPLTSAGSFVGTAAYLAPEQAAGKPPTKRGDFYSLGCVLYALVTGRPPFAGASVTELLHQHRFAQPEQPIRLVPDLPHDVNAIILQLLEKDPAKRPADGSVLLKSIDRILGKLARRGEAGGETLIQPDTDQTLLHHSDFTGDNSHSGPGPATFAAGFIRAELKRLNAGGPVARFFNHPIVLVAMFFVCVALIAYGVWRPQPTAESLMAAARPLMESTDPRDWERAWRDSLQPLSERFPNQYKDQIAEFRQRLRDYHDREKFMSRAKKNPASEAERFYQRGLLLLQAGDTGAARRMWSRVIAAYGGIDDERRWVLAASDAIRELDKTPKPSLAATDAALEKARQLKAEGKLAEATAIWDALEKLYRDDPENADILQEIRRDREK